MASLLVISCNQLKWSRPANPAACFKVYENAGEN